MTLPVELETSVTQLRAKHTALIDAVTAYRSGTIDASKQDLLTLADDIDKQLTVEEHTLLGQVARKGRIPSLLLDFANDKYAVGDRRLERFTSLGELVTFSRSTGGGRFNTQGQYEWVPANTPRIDYDPVTGECLGLLMEEQRTNLFTESGLRNGLADLDVQSGSALYKQGGIGPVSAAGHLEISRADSGSSSAYRRVDFEPDVTYTFTAFVEMLDGGEPIPSNGPPSGPYDLLLVMFGAGSIPSSTYTKRRVSETVWAVSRTGNSGSMVNQNFGVIKYEGMSDRAFRITGFQLEVGSFPTSYIPTEGAVVTRGRDISRVQISANRAFGTLLARFIESGIPATEGGSIALSNDSSGDQYGTGALGLYLSRLSNFGFQARPLGANYSTLVSDSYVPGEPVTQGMAYALGSPVLFAAAGEVSSDAIVTRLAPSKPIFNLMHGSDGVSKRINGHIESLRYYPFAMTESELQEITAQ